MPSYLIFVLTFLVCVFRGLLWLFTFQVFVSFLLFQPFRLFWLFLLRVIAFLVFVWETLSPGHVFTYLLISMPFFLHVRLWVTTFPTFVLVLISLAYQGVFMSFEPRVFLLVSIFRAFLWVSAFLAFLGVWVFPFCVLFCQLFPAVGEVFPSFLVFVILFSCVYAFLLHLINPHPLDFPPLPNTSLLNPLHLYLLAQLFSAEFSSQAV